MVQFFLNFRNVMIVAILAGVSCHCLADDLEQTKGSSPLGIRQQRVKRMMQELDRKFQDLAQKLQATEPEQAKLLIKAFQQSRERLIEKRMEEISSLLDTSNFSDADKKQGEVQLELDAVLRVLLDQSKDWDHVNAEMERLESTRKAVQELLEKQRDQLHETDRLANHDKTVADLDEQIKELSELIEAQTQISQKTEQTKSNEQPELNKLATEQDELQQKTDRLSNSMGKQDSESKASADKPSSSGVEKCKSCLGNASKSQKSASQKLAQALPQDAQKDEQKSLEQLKKAADALKEERDRIARLPKEMLDQMAQKQEATSEDAKKLIDEMNQMPENKSESGPKGKKNVEQAQQSMQQAADGLRQSDAKAAAKEQEKAVDELKQALDQIEKRLAQLREETLIDRLARLEARFRNMLSKQKEVTQSTVSVHAKQTAAGKLTRGDLLGLRKLATEERELAEEANQTNEMLIEDGTSIVFPRVVANLQSDLLRLGDLLEEGRADEYTQALQQDVAVTLQELIDALQRNLQKKKSQGGGGECNCEPPLVPGSAELKMLRSMQLRVHHRTELLGKVLESGELDASMNKEVTALTEMQKKVAEMALEMSEKYK